MENIYWILIGITTLIILFSFMFLFRKSKHTINYHNLLIIGVVWLIIGIPTKNYVLSIIGIIIIITGLVHRKDWKKDKKRWKDMNKNEKKIFIIFIVALLLGFVIGISIYYFLGQEAIINTDKFAINSFESCLSAGHPVMESYPRQCRAGDETFTEVIIGDYFQG